MYNVVLFSDAPSADWFSRGYGAYRLASQIRYVGYSAITVDFASALVWKTFTEIIDRTVGPDTLVVGFSSTWFPYRHQNLDNPRYVVGFKSVTTNPEVDFTPEDHPWYADSLAYNISGGNIQQYVDYIKQRNPRTKVVLGGAKAYEYVFESAFDNVFIGYSENQFIDYVNAMTIGPKRIFNHIVNYDVKAQSGAFDFKSSSTKYVTTDCLHPEEILTFEFSRGCIFNCTFCSYPHRNQDTRNYVKYQEVIYNELLENYNNYGVYKYVITDDTFNDYVEKLEVIAEVIQSLPFKPEFWAYVRQDLVSRNPYQAELLKIIGVKETYYGLETWHDPTARAIRKGGDRQKKIDGMRICKEVWGNDVYTVAGIVIGLPLDTVQSLNDSAQWYQEEGHKYVDLFGYGALTLRDYQEFGDYIFKSDIEQDMSKYGYSIPDPDKDPLQWIRKDSGDITSKDQANQLMVEVNAKVSPFWNQQRVWDWRAIFKATDPDYDQHTATELFYRYASLQYFPKLLQKI